MRLNAIVGSGLVVALLVACGPPRTEPGALPREAEGAAVVVASDTKSELNPEPTPAPELKSEPTPSAAPAPEPAPKPKPSPKPKPPTADRVPALAPDPRPVRARLEGSYVALYCTQKAGDTRKIRGIYGAWGFADPRDWRSAWEVAQKDNAWLAELTQKALNACP